MTWRSTLLVSVCTTYTPVYTSSNSDKEASETALTLTSPLKNKTKKSHFSHVSSFFILWLMFLCLTAEEPIRG